MIYFQPYSPITRIITSARWLQFSIALLLLCIVFSYPLLDLIQRAQQITQLAQDNQALQADKQQKQHILTILKNKIVQENQHIDPQIAANIPPLNQQLQQIAAAYSDLTIDQQQWQFLRTAQHPLKLQLELQGSFYSISHFLRKLPFDQLALLKLELHHDTHDRQTSSSLDLLFIKELHYEN